MEVDSGRSLVMSTWRTSPTVVSMAGSPVSVLYPQVCASMPPISIDMGRAVSFLRTAGCARFLGVGYGPADEEEPEAAGALFPPQAARAPVPASMSPPSRNCRREKLFVMVQMSLGKVGVTQGERIGQSTGPVRQVRRRSVTQVTPSSVVENSVVPVRP